MNAVNLQKSGGECGKKHSRLVAVKLNKSSAEFSGDFT